MPANGYVNAEIVLRDGEADLPALQAELDRMVGHPVEISDLHQQVKRDKHATDVERTALYAAAAAAAAASVLLIGQALLRTTAAPAAELPVLQAMGVTRRQRLWALAARPDRRRRRRRAGRVRRGGRAVVALPDRRGPPLRAHARVPASTGSCSAWGAP